VCSSDLPRTPEDAREQIASGIELFTRVTGQAPAGYWPSEGALSDEVLDHLEAAGIRWAATDQELLTASLRRAGMESRFPPPVLSPFRFGNRKISIFFRDRILSDLIGFTYASWHPSAAASDFVDRLRAIAGRRPAGRRGAVAVILDGENAWETYPKNGADFLDALYGAIEAAPELRAVTFSRHLLEDPEAGELPRLSAGSWIRGDLNTWIGHPEKNRAWELLSAARSVFVAAGRPAAGLRWLRAAQGSDWFWWFGDDHSSTQDSTFDQLFRAYLMQVYIACRVEPPPELAVAIKRHPGRRRILDPTGSVSPTIDGRVTDYFEWLGAGSVVAEPSSAAIYASGAAVRSLQFGADGSALSVRMDAIKPPFSETVDAGELVIAIAQPKPAGIALSLDPKRTLPAGCEIACRKILEAKVPLSLVDLAPGDRCEFTVMLRDRKGDPIATFPPEGTLTLRIPTPADASDDWSA
jgi:hypothetical protein